MLDNFYVIHENNRNIIKINMHFYVHIIKLISIKVNDTDSCIINRIISINKVNTYTVF